MALQIIRNFNPPMVLRANEPGTQNHDTNNKDIARIRSVASQFEAVLLSTLLGPLQKSFSSLPGASSQPQSGEYDSLEIQALTSGLAAAGGFGIGNIITRNLLRTQGQNYSDTGKAGPAPGR